MQSHSLKSLRVSVQLSEAITDDHTLYNFTLHCTQENYYKTQDRPPNSQVGLVLSIFLDSTVMKT